MVIKTFPTLADFHRLSRQANVIPVYQEVLADTETPVSLLQKFLRRDKPVFLFESVEGGEQWGRYSFLGTSAKTHIQIFQDDVTVGNHTGSRRISHQGNPFAVLRELMGRYRPAEIDGLPRFWGGLVGYLTYEMVSFIERIPHKLPRHKPLAHFVIPDEVIIFDNLRHTLMAVVTTFRDDGSEEDERIQRIYTDALVRIERLLDFMERPTPTAGTDYPHMTVACEADLNLKPAIANEVYRSRVDAVKDRIRAGDIIQAVISQPFNCPAPTDLWSFYRAQRYINPSPYLFFLRFPEMALIGSSPETMVRLENGVATLRPIAGTRPRGMDEQSDRRLADELLADEKERAEHLMLVDLGRNDLGRVAATGSVQVTDLMVVERYSHVMHLVSNIRCDLRSEYDAWDLLQATFPAGTLSGAPKVWAMKLIAELETQPRGPYGGAVGYISFSGNMDLAITIRTACVEQGRLQVRAGAGIVADSDPETERQETVNKAQALQRALELMQQND